ncbi:MAG: exodeoxyribonuclease V subunit gamma [Candidatus Kapabacteria bacterium]|nr:exodeoxyribonuclease V subunit gamma [Candidatus Kapabacteria bacterium]
MSHILCNEALKKLKKFSLNEIYSEAIINDKPFDLVFIFPTGKYVRYFKQNFIKEYYSKHKKPLSYLKIFTLQSFIQVVFNSLELSKEYKLLSDGYRLALFEEAVEKSNLKFYKSKSKKISNSVLIKLFSLIYGLREDGITLEKLKNDFNSISNSLPENLSYFTDTHRMADIIKIYESYENLLSGKHIDFPKLLLLTIEELNKISIPEFQQKIREILGNDSKIYLDGFTDFKKPEISFLSFFVSSSNPFGIHIDYAFNPLKQNGNGPLFGNLEDIIINFHNSGFHLITLSDYPNEKIKDEDEIFNKINVSTKQVLFSDTHGYLRRWLFNTEKELKNPNLSKFIKILIAENRKEETKYIAKLIRYLINFKGYSPNEICVCSRQPEHYSGLFREIFTRYKIPSNITDRFNLAQSPVVNAILSILEIINRGFRIEDVERALNNSYLCFDQNNNSKKIDKRNLINAAKQLRIKGGNFLGRENDWLRKLESFTNNLKNARSLETTQTGDELELKKMTTKLESIQNANEDFKLFLDLLKFNTKKLNVFDFQSIVSEIIKKFQIINIIEKNYFSILEDNTLDRFWKNLLLEQCENDAKAIESFIKILEEMTLVISDLMPNLTTSIEFYIDKLKTSITNTKYQISEKQGYGVTVTSIEQTRGIPFKVMFLCGAIDGEFLLKYTPNQFLGIELPDSEKRHIHNERMLFYQFLTNTPEYFETNEKQIFISYFKNDDSGEKVRSPFIDALLKISTLNEDGCIIDLTAINKIEESTQNDFSTPNYENDWLKSISNIEELYYQISKSDLSNFEKVISLEHQVNLDFIKKYRQRPLELTNLEESSSSTNDKNDSNSENNQDRIYSITELETYSACPFKYFIKYFLNIEEPLVIDYSIPAVEIGSLLHRVLYKFYKEIQLNQSLNPDELNQYDEIIKFLQKIGNNQKPVILYPDKKDYYLSVLKQLTNEEFQKIKFEHPFYDLDRESILGVQKIPGFLEIWLNAEIEKHNNWVFLPALFEFSFGLTKDPLDFGPVLIDNHFKLKGKIDRIEFAVIDNKLSFMISDYKSNFNYLAKLSDILDGTSFQMPLYLIAAKNIFMKIKKDINASGAVYYNLKPKYKDGKIQYFTCLMIPPSNPIKQLLGKSKSQFLVSDNELNDVLNKSMEHSKNVVDNISSLIFPVNPLDASVCRNCSYISACRIKEKKLILEDNSVET